jgi:exodeoxyribonuclease V beta subunit
VTDAFPEFSITDPLLPSGLTVLEASAGTGKTYSLAGLVTRYVAETGLQASELCVVSFTEAATAELRGRIRDKLVEAARHLETGEESSDEVVALLLADVEQRHLRHQRIVDALAEFDTATISTIHGFCSRVVATGSGSAVDATFTADDSDVDEVVNDLFLARYGATGRWPAEVNRVAQAARLRLRIPDAVMYRPDPSDLKPAQHERAEQIEQVIELVDAVVAEVHRRRSAARRRTFDSLLVEARDLLRGPTLAATRAVLRQRFKVVMIDEFQDTDRVQWDIFRTAFCDPPDPVTVIVVGDPKQSIYRFRSAELSAYLDARALAGTRTSLGTNWRSDASMLAGLERLFDGYTFGSPDVAFQPVRAAEPDQPVVLHDPTEPRSLQLRVIDPVLGTDEANAAARRDLVAEVVRMLTEVTVDDPRADGGPRPLAASDIGVLVRSNADATAIVAQLSSAGVPAASSSNDSVLDSAAAAQWRVLLSALERPSSVPRAKAAALSWFVGLTPAELDALDTDGGDGLGELVERLRGWALCLATGGLASLMAQLRAEGLMRRVLTRAGGERDLTDLDHLLELMQSSVGGRSTAAAALLSVLDGLLDPDLADENAVAPELLSRRIDRDDDTVKVLTVHRAKGLEFPVVLCPTLWRKRPSLQGVPHADVGGQRLIDTNKMLPTKSEAQPFKALVDADKAERQGEDSRLLYVALTRAEHRLVVWWTPVGNNKTVRSPLGDLLHAAGAPDGASPMFPDATDVLSEVPVVVPEHRPRLRRADDGVRPVLGVATADRPLDRSWYRWSFSSIKDRIGQLAEEAAELDRPAMGGVDEPSEVVPPLEVSPAVVPAATPLQGAPAGTAFGTLVHSVMERVDFTAPDLPDQLRERLAELLHYRAMPTTPDALAEGLLVALATPLGGPMGGRSLLTLEHADRLDELSFDLQLGRLDARTLAATVLGHLPTDDRLRGWFAETADGALPVEVAGLLTGSIDLVARTGPGASATYWLADYKTNLLPDGRYGADELAGAMAHHGYPLQATLYLVALHRYLRWRLRGYDPDTHLGGAAYLFLRGMHPTSAVGPDGSRPGVVWWRPPTAAILELDRLLAGAPSGGAAA